MPPPATRRFSLLLLPPEIEDPPDRVDAALRALGQAGFVTSDGRPGLRGLVEGGFAALTREGGAGVVFLSNGQGGFRVACPRTGESAVPAFNRAITAWRAGGPRRLACPCGQPHDLADLRYRPAAGFARAWLRLADPARAELTPEGEAALVAAWGGAQGAAVRIVGRRG